MIEKVNSVLGKSNPPNRNVSDGKQCYASVIGLLDEKEKYYRELHADVWESVANQIKECNISNYSIFIGNLFGRKILFSYFEYTGSDFDADMAKMAEDPETRRWWHETDPCQFPVEPSQGDGWLDLERVFFLR